MAFQTIWSQLSPEKRGNVVEIVVAYVRSPLFSQRRRCEAKAEFQRARSFLRAVGAGAVALPFYRLVEDHFAKADGETLPLRFIGVYHPHGIAAEYFVMQYSGNPFPSGPVSTTPDVVTTSGGVDTTTNFASRTRTARCSRSTTQPPTARATRARFASSRGSTTSRTPTVTTRRGRSSPAARSTVGPQAAQLVDRSVPGGRERPRQRCTPVTSIQLGVGDDGTESGTTLSYSEGGIALPKILDPVQAFNTLFGELRGAQQCGGAGGAMRQQQLGHSGVELRPTPTCRASTASWRRRSNRSCRPHLDALSDLEEELLGEHAHGGANCMVPAQAELGQRFRTCSAVQRRRALLRRHHQGAHRRCWRRPSPATSRASRRCS